MNKKSKIVLSTFLVASSLSVACAVLATSVNGQTFRAKGAPTVDYWSEKPYIAPTGTDVGYKHYYLGCPGNYRTSDAEHEVEVSLEEITIPVLNVIDRSEVAEGSEILNMDESKIKFCDQSIDFYDKNSGGHAVFVEDQGHQATFISRSNNLDVGDERKNYPTEFRYSKNMSHVSSITFEYRYLDYSNYVYSAESTSHIFTQVKRTAGGYPVYQFDFINDDQWHTANIIVDSEDMSAFLIKAYDMRGHIYISNLQFHGFGGLNLEAASVLDAIAPVTISDLGFESGVTVPQQSTANHLFTRYDFEGNKGIDLWFKPNYSIHAGDWCTTYLFNGRDEDGIVFRYDFARIEDDGILRVYVYTTRAYGPATTVINGAANAYYRFPRMSGVTSTADVVMHITAYCIDEANNTFRCQFTAGVVGGPQVNITSDDTPEDTTNTPMTFDIELGSDYFEAGTKDYIRFSSTTDDYRLFDSEAEEAVVVYKDDDGTLMGKKTGSTIATFDYQKSGKTFVGWFDHKGERVLNGQQANGKTIVRPLFVTTKTDMMVPSTTGVFAKGEKFVVNQTTVPDEAGSAFGYEASSNRIDLYLIYQPVRRGNGDKYAIIGFPYDFIDGQTRLNLRINENSDIFDGFIYGGSLGEAGADGTSFTCGSSFRKLGDSILVRIGITDNGSGNIDIYIEFINIGTHLTMAFTRNATFAGYSMTDTARNKMCLKVVNDLEYNVYDAF